jgi:2',3'-cyclic-nucleotide 2'-phosphodiesterase (5'-nucleotidase family)
VVQANVEVSEGGGFAPVGRGSAVLTVEGVRVGVIGVIGEPQFQKIRAPEGVEFRFRDPAVAVEEQAAALRPQAELIVVVGCVTDGEAADLARRVGGVDVWVSGYDSIPSDRPVPAGEQTLLCRTGQRGQYLSVTQLIVSPSGAIVEHGGRNIPLDARVPTDAGVDALVTQLLGETATRGCR